MRDLNLEDDGWELESGEARHSAASGTFCIPPLAARQSLQPGDYAKLIFRIRLDDEADPVSVERMWVVVRGRLGDTYLGVLQNRPAGIAENDRLWLSTELPFRPEHVIDIEPGDEVSVDLARSPPRRPWLR